MENNSETNAGRKSSKSPIIILLAVFIAIAVVGIFLFIRGGIDLDSRFTGTNGTLEPEVEEEISEEEREEIIQAMVETDRVMRSGDVDAIKLKLSQVYPELVGEFSDEDIEQISEFYDQTIPPATAELLRSDDVSWTIERGRAFASLTIDGMEGVYEAVKIDGVWY